MAPDREPEHIGTIAHRVVWQLWFRQRQAGNPLPVLPEMIGLDPDRSGGAR